MSEILWCFNEIVPVRKAVLNPRPVVPETGWKRPTSMPSLRGASRIALDLETWDPDLDDFGPGYGRGVGHIVGVSVATNDGFCGYYPIRHTDEVEDNFEPEVVFRWLREELGREWQLKVGHNLSYDYGWLLQENVKIRGHLWDTFIAERLINYRDPASLEATAMRRVGAGKDSTTLYAWLHAYFGKGNNPGPKELRSMIAHVAKAPPRL